MELLHAPELGASLVDELAEVRLLIRGHAAVEQSSLLDLVQALLQDMKLVRGELLGVALLADHLILAVNERGTQLLPGVHRKLKIPFRGSLNDTLRKLRDGSFKLLSKQLHAFLDTALRHVCGLLRACAVKRVAVSRRRDVLAPAVVKKLATLAVTSLWRLGYGWHNVLVLLFLVEQRVGQERHSGTRLHSNRALPGLSSRKSEHRVHQKHALSRVWLGLVGSLAHRRILGGAWSSIALSLSLLPDVHEGKSHHAADGCTDDATDHDHGNGSSGNLALGVSGLGLELSAFRLLDLGGRRIASVVRLAIFRVLSLAIRVRIFIIRHNARPICRVRGWRWWRRRQLLAPACGTRLEVLRVSTLLSIVFG
mmetsp:Transcript_3019/g.8174  ORF Transcript_3019/g.8174 Transcript_3019/m.8174 type:complete len:367 (+) Transcript_3019:203-1303(+)